MATIATVVSPEHLLNCSVCGLKQVKYFNEVSLMLAKNLRYVHCSKCNHIKGILSAFQSVWG